MALKLGYRPRDVRQSYWRGDPDVKVTDEAAYTKTGDRAHCKVAAGGTPTLVTFRALTHEEDLHVQSFRFEQDTHENDGLRRVMLAFRLAVDFPEETFADEHGQPLKEHRVKEHGFDMLHESVMHGLLDSPRFGWAGLLFYAGLITGASQPDDDAFLASPPPSTATSMRTRRGSRKSRARPSTPTESPSAPTGNGSGCTVPTGGN